MLHAALSPASARLQLLIVSLPAICFVCCKSGATCCPIHTHQCCLLADIGAVSVVVCSVVMLVILRNSLVVFVLIQKVNGGLLAQPAIEPAAPAPVASSDSGTGQVFLHVENCLLAIFLLVCETSAPASSWRDAWRQQTSCAAAAELLAKWRAAGSCCGWR